MAGEALEKLMYSIGLIDKVSGPAKGIDTVLQRVHKTMVGGGAKMALGGGAIAGAALGLVKFSESANEMGNVLERMAGAGVGEEALDSLKKASASLAMDYAANAQEVVQSGEFMKNNIAGISDGAITVFAKNSALMAKAGNESIEVMNELYKSAANSAGDEMKAMGDAPWADMFASKVAAASRKANVPIGKLAESMKALGNVGYNLGMSSSDQLATMATLQAGGMDATEAGGGMDQMMMKASQIKVDLGFDIYGENGKMRNISAIVDDFKAVAKKKGMTDVDMMSGLEKLFGKGPAAKMMFTLMKNSDKLKDNLDAVGKASGLDELQKRAAANADEMDKFGATVGVIKTSIAFALLPMLNTAAAAMSYVLQKFVWLLDVFPPLKWAIVGVMLAAAALTVIWGTMTVVTGSMAIWEGLIMKLHVFQAGLWKAGIITGRMTLIQKAAAVANFLWTKSVTLASAATWLFSAALWANPITWIVIGILAAVAAVVLLIKYWDKVTGAFTAAWDWFKNTFPNLAGLIAKFWPLLFGPLAPLVFALRDVINHWDEIKSAAGAALSWIGAQIGNVADGIKATLMPGINMASEAFSYLGDLGDTVWGTIKNSFASIDGVIGGVLRTLAKIPGFGDLNPDAGKTAVAAQPTVGAGTEARKTDINAGGIRPNVSNNTTNYGGVTINTSAAIGPGELEDMWALQGG